MENPVRAFYKARVTYKNPEWIDGISTLEDMKYFNIKDIVLSPPPGSNLDVVAQHAMAQGSLSHFWSGIIPVVTGDEVYIHPNRIIAVTLVHNVETITVKPRSKVK